MAISLRRGRIEMIKSLARLEGTLPDWANAQNTGQGFWSIFTQLVQPRPLFHYYHLLPPSAVDAVGIVGGKKFDPTDYTFVLSLAFLDPKSPDMVTIKTKGVKIDQLRLAGIAIIRSVYDICPLHDYRLFFERKKREHVEEHLRKEKREEGFSG